MSSAEDRTEKASPKRIREAREKGQVPRSRELGAAVVVLAVAIMLIRSGPGIAERAAYMLTLYIEQVPATLARPQDLPQVAGGLVLALFGLALPILLAALAAGVAATLAVGGWNFAPNAMAPDFSRLNPAKGIARMFSAQTLVELGKSLLKVALLAVIAWLVISSSAGRLMSLGNMPVAAAIAEGVALAVRALAWMSAGLIVIAVIDVPWQLHSYAKNLRMTKQEVRDEYKQSEGQPEVKAKIRRAQMEASRGRMMEALPTADVVVTNPTHYAVALAYKSGSDRAPKVVAKGMDFLAQEIKARAAEYKITIVEAPPLARALYRNVELDDEIPVALYQAVAQVLSYVFQLREMAKRPGPAPKLPRIAEDLPGGEEDPERT